MNVSGHTTAFFRRSANAFAVRSVFRFSQGQLLVALVVLFAAVPFFDNLVWGGEAVLTVLLTLVMGSALLAVGGRKGAMVGGIFLILPAIALRVVPHFTGVLYDNPVALACRGLFIAFTVWQLLRFVLRAQRVTGEVLCAGVSIYLLMGLLWSSIYLLDAALIPGAFRQSASALHLAPFTFSESFYFSFCALTTANYGDIIPVSHFARQHAIMESVTGVLYVAILIARLITLYSATAAASAEKE